MTPELKQFLTEWLAWGAQAVGAVRRLVSGGRVRILEAKEKAMSTTDWKPVNDEVPCRKCEVVGRIEHAVWKSSCGGFEDDHYRCLACGKDWWVEGPDA